MDLFIDENMLIFVGFNKTGPAQFSQMIDFC
jgi:hypothetical protein